MPFVSLPKRLDWTRWLQIIHIHNIRRKQVNHRFPKLPPAKFSCIYWVTHVGFKSPTPTMKMETNFTTSKSKPHRPTGLTRTHDAGWMDGIAITLFFTSLSALLSKLVVQSSASTVANPDDAKGNDVDLSIYKGKVLLIVNVASQCALTNSNYKELSQLYEKYKDQASVKFLNKFC
ncbi:unnamed protein product [Camellia sinensis]